MKLYVGNLSKQITEAQLSELATPYGALVSTNVLTNPANGESRGFGFIEFGSAAEGMSAITGLHGRDVNGQVLQVVEARPRR